MQLVHKKGPDSGSGLLPLSALAGQVTRTRPKPFTGRLDGTSVPPPFVCPGFELGIRPSHPLGQLVLPSEVDPRVLAWQK